MLVLIKLVASSVWDMTYLHIYSPRYLEGYKLEINGKTYCHLGPASQSCQLTKCKPGKKYHVVLVALTCTENGKKERKCKVGDFSNLQTEVFCL